MSKPSQFKSFEIHLAQSHKVLQVRADQTALQVLIDAGIEIEPGCMLGGCGMCAIDYLDGDVLHKDLCLGKRERESQFCPCVSRALTRIVIPF